MLKAAICDDCRATIAQLENILAKVPTMVEEYDTFESGTEILHLLETRETKYNIFLLGIEKPGLDGLSLARKIREFDKRALIIFLTDQLRCGINLFEVMVFDLLNIPFSFNQIKKVLERAKQYLDLTNEPFYFSFNRSRFAVENREILYFEKVNRKVYIHTEETKYETYLSMQEVWNRITEETFVPIAYSYFVNMEFIRETNSREVVLKNRQHLPVSRNYKRTVQEKYRDFLQRRR